MRGRLLASVLACPLVVGGGAGVGFGEPRPAEGISFVDREVPASSPAGAVSPERGYTLKPAGGLSDTRSKP